MSSDRRFEQDLPRLLDELYTGSMPAYRDHVLDETARIRQRPAWSFPERWLPMLDIARPPIAMSRLPWRAVGLGLGLLVLLLAMFVALFVGSRPRLPTPFGRAQTGLVAYASAGDIYTADAVTGNPRAIVTGSEVDVNPRWSRDGTRLAFQRTTGTDSTSDVVYTVRPDGSDMIRVTPDPLSGVTGYAFSPDGTQLLISADINGTPGLLIAAVDGTSIRQLNVGMAATNAAWRPPNGAEILFMDNGDDSGGWGAVHLVSSDGGSVRTLVPDERFKGHYRGHPLWSPDGSLISFGEWCDRDCSTGAVLPSDAGLTVQVHVVKADGTGDRVLPSPAGAQWQAPESWSNDGTRMLVIRGYTGGVEQGRPALVPIDGSPSSIEIPYPGGMGTPPTTAFEWAPDDSLILGTPTDPSGTVLDQMLLDPVNRTVRALTWSSGSEPSWQRLAP